MGKDLKGKELGNNLSQRPDKKYIARFTDKYGKRHNYISASLVECRKWLADSTYDDEHSDLYGNHKNMSVKAWYDYWIDYKSKTIKASTITSYKGLWVNHIEPVIGNMMMKDVKVQHCQLIMNKMANKGMSEKTVSDIKRAYNSFFEMAVEYEIINKNPLTKANGKIGRKTKKKIALTVEQQRQFLDMFYGTDYYNHFALILQTGLRIAEVVGLKWCDVDFGKKTLTVNQQLHMVNNVGWEYTTPKSVKSNRVIPLTKEAERILLEQKIKCSKLKVIPMEWKDVVFLNNDGMPICQDTIDNYIKRIMNRNGVKPTSCHILRHTFATRCIEAGMKPKALQAILGHSNLATTMDLYVDIFDDEKQREIEKIEEYLIVNL